MSRYHINQATGKVSACRATKRCPFGDLEKDHYKSPQAAREAYEKDQDTFSPNPALIPLASALIVAKPKVSNNAVAAEADYDSYGPPGWGCECDPDDYCRCSTKAMQEEKRLKDFVKDAANHLEDFC